MIRILAIIIFCLLNAQNLEGISRFSKNEIPYTVDINQMRPSLQLPVVDKKMIFNLPKKNLVSRIMKFKKDERIEEVALTLSSDSAKIAELADGIAKGDPALLTKTLMDFYKSAKPVSEGSEYRKVVVDKKLLKLIDLKKLSAKNAHEHRKLMVKADELNGNPSLKLEFMQQISSYLGKDEKKSVYRKIANMQDVDVDSLLLPKFARKYVGRFINFRGPNCFHAALAFQGERIPKSKFINVKREKGYHPAMINYDELWKFITSRFYEVDPKASPLKYGDLLVFFEIEPGKTNLPVNFKNIRHTTTYLFNQYAFSKGSKSPNTPYSIKTLADEFNTWRRITKALGVKIFRRSHAQIPSRPVADSHDWVF